MGKASNFKVVSRAITVLAVIVAIVGGVTFAALQSQAAVLKGNTIQTAVASLQVSSDGTTYSNSLDGFVFGNLIPGGQPSPASGYPVYLKNVGTTPLALKLSVSGPVSNPNAVDLSKVHVILSPLGGGAGHNFTLADLMAANATGGMALTLGGANRIVPSVNVGFTVQVSLESDAVGGPSATIGNIDFNFGASAVN